MFFSKYISQVSRQITLDKVFNMLFVNDTKINFINISELPEEISDDTNKLKIQLLNNNMTYLGCVNDDGKIVFESKHLETASKVIVLSD